MLLFLFILDVSSDDAPCSNGKRKYIVQMPLQPQWRNMASLQNVRSATTISRRLRTEFTLPNYFVKKLDTQILFINATEQTTN